jgi:hypothetical protein
MRAIIKFLLGVVLILAVIWGGAWWYAEGRMQAGITNWADGLATQGWKISYDSITRGTSPFSAVVNLANLQLTPPPGPQGRTATVTLPTAALRIDIADPLLLHTDLPNRIGVDIGGTVDAAVSVSAISLTEQLDPKILLNHGDYPYRSGDFSASGVDILASQGSLLVLHMDRLVSHFAVNPEAGATMQAFAADESVDGLALSPLVTHLLGIPFGGRVTHLSFGLALSGPVPPGSGDLAAKLKALPMADQAGKRKLVIPVLHDWAAAGGHGNVMFAGTVGPTTLASDGDVKFDANLQPHGTANLTADHLDQFFGTLTNAYPALQDHVSQVMAALSPYITTSDAGGQSLAMHVVYGAGAVAINGQKTGALPPLNWDALENPAPAAPIPAP